MYVAKYYGSAVGEFTESRAKFYLFNDVILRVDSKEVRVVLNACRSLSVSAPMKRLHKLASLKRVAASSEEPVQRMT